MNRKNYALTNALAFPVCILLIFAGNFVFSDERLLIFYFVGATLLLLTCLISSLERLNNIGKSKLWAIGIYLPLINFYVVPMLWSYPPKAKENGLDKKAYVIFILVFLLAVLGTAIRSL